MPRLGSRMREHIAKVLSAYTPGKGEQAMHASCIAWLASLSDPKPAKDKVNPKALECALASTAKHKHSAIVDWTPSLYARLSNKATALKVTTDAMATVGNWVYSQDWLKQVTLISALQRWEDWLARAQSYEAARGQSIGNSQGSTAW